MKNLVILGASRAGKTTLAYQINKIYPNYHIINGDSVRDAFGDALPQNEINANNGNGMKQDFSRFLGALLKYQFSENAGIYNYIVETCDVSVENALKFFQEENTIIVYLGYPKLNPEEAFRNYRKYEKPTDWTIERADKQLIEFAKVWTSNSKIFEEDCKRYGVKYVDTSYNREEVLKKLINELVEELNN